MDWFYLARGKKSNPLLLFLHGFMGLAEDWSEVIDRLEGDYYCIAPDLPGHGRNGLPRNRDDMTMPSVARDLLRFLDRLEVRRTTLIGYSMGARLGLYLALHCPDRFKSLILESGGPGIDDEYERKVRVALDDDRACQLRIFGLERFLDEWYRAPLFESLQRHPELLERLKTLRKAHNAEGLAAALQGLGTGRQPSLWSKLEQLRLPTLLITGALDHKFSRLNRIMSESIPFCEWKMIGDAGHNTHIEQPEAYVTSVRRFLAAHLDKIAVNKES